MSFKDWRENDMGIELIIKKIVVEQLGIDLDKTELLSDTNLQSIGMNSIEFVKLIVEIEGAFDIEYPDDKLLITESGTLGQITATVKSCLNSDND